MTIEPGSKVGPYEVLGPLGKGGMGEVFRARDNALGRDVAIKILPVAFAGDADRLARFEREAQALASLNHPNIAQVYAIEAVSTGSAGPQGRAIIMELVDGEDLSERIAPGPLPLDEALSLARQIAFGLEAAHDAGIIHRDLKPANIKVKADGTAKILDFGLAKALGADSQSSSSALANSPTLTARATELGVILGTAAYMAPEQAKGRAVDRRADVWAFGVVLYEMLTGRRAFGGDDVTEVMAAVIRDTPDLKALPLGTPPAVKRLLRRCLEKDPKKRLRDMGDVGVELDDAISTPGVDEAGPAAGATAPTRRSPMVMVAAAAALVVTASLATWALVQPPVVDHPVTRFIVDLPQGQQISSLGLANVALSRDGRRLAYRADGGIWVRDLDQMKAREVAKAIGSGVWFSFDGEMVLYYTNQTGLWKVPVSGGPSLPIATTGQVVGADWGEDGTIVYSDAGKHLFRVPATGGTPVSLFDAPENTGAVWPQILPDGKNVLFTSREDAGESLHVVPLAGGEPRIASAGLAGAWYVSTGHLLYGLEGRLMAQPFDLGRMETTGAATPMPEAVYTSAQTYYAQAHVSDTGTLAYVTGQDSAKLALAWVDEKGAATPAFTVPRNYSDIVLSPDGRRVATHLWDEDNDIWVADLQRGGLTRITFTPEEEETPVWSPNGQELAFGVTRGANRALIIKSADGGAASAERQVWESKDHFHVTSWSSDGQTLIVEIARSATKNDLVAVDVKTGTARDLLTSPYAEYNARLSPDGKWLSYVSNESGRPDVFVQPYPSLSARVPVSTAGGKEPVWSHDGRRLFFRTSDSLMVADLTSTSPLEFSAPRVFTADHYVRTQGNYHTHFDVAKDGRLLVIQDPNAATSSGHGEINVVLNWTESLKQAAPVKK